jgi:hypothetical protein
VNCLLQEISNSRNPLPSVALLDQPLHAQLQGQGGQENNSSLQGPPSGGAFRGQPGQPGAHGRPGDGDGLPDVRRRRGLRSASTVERYVVPAGGAQRGVDDRPGLFRLDRLPDAWLVEGREVLLHAGGGGDVYPLPGLLEPVGAGNVIDFHLGKGIAL